MVFIECMNELSMVWTYAMNSHKSVISFSTETWKLRISVFIILGIFLLNQSDKCVLGGKNQTHCCSFHKFYNLCNVCNAYVSYVTYITTKFHNFSFVSNEKCILVMRSYYLDASKLFRKIGPQSWKYHISHAFHCLIFFKKLEN